MKNDDEQLREDLERFLTFKFEKNGYDLELELESKTWKDKFTNWPKIRELLTPKDHPIDYIRENPRRGVTIILPKTNDDTGLNFQFFKGAAYFPHELDPRIYEEGWIYDKDILYKLAYATHHRYFAARIHLVWLDDAFPLLKGHRMCEYKDIPYMNAKEYYYEFPVPAKHHGHPKYKNNLDFDPKTDKTKLSAFCDHLVQIAKTGNYLTKTEQEQIQKQKQE